VCHRPLARSKKPLLQTCRFTCGPGKLLVHADMHCSLAFLQALAWAAAGCWIAVVRLVVHTLRDTPVAAAPLCRGTRLQVAGGSARISLRPHRAGEAGMANDPSKNGLGERGSAVVRRAQIVVRAFPVGRNDHLNERPNQHTRPLNGMGILGGAPGLPPDHGVFTARKLFSVVPALPSLKPCPECHQIRLASLSHTQGSTPRTQLGAAGARSLRMGSPQGGWQLHCCQEQEQLHPPHPCYPKHPHTATCSHITAYISVQSHDLIWPGKTVTLCYPAACCPPPAAPTPPCCTSTAAALKICRPDSRSK